MLTLIESLLFTKTRGLGRSVFSRLLRSIYSCFISNETALFKSYLIKCANSDKLSFVTLFFYWISIFCLN